MKYNLIGEDEKVFKIKHPDGSEFHISKNSISPALHVKIKALKLADGGEVPDPSEAEPSPALMVEPATDREAQSVAEPKPLMIEPASDEEVSATPVRSPAVAKTDQAPIVQDVPKQDEMAKSYAEAFKQKEAGIKGMADAAADAAKAQAVAYQAQVDQAAKIMADANIEGAKIKAENAQLYKDVYEGKIDPSRFLSNMSTGNKILAAISVFMGGLGAGIQGHGAPNAALGIIRDSIQNDIEAQKAELGKKQNLLSENLRRYGDLNSATQATMLQLNAATQAKVAQAAAKSGSLQAQANAKILLSDLGMQAAQLNQQLAMKQAASQGGGDPTGLVRFLVPEPHQKAVFEEISRAQDTRRMGDAIIKSFDEAAKDNTVLKTGAGLLRTPGSVYALHQAMQPTFKDLEGTVRQAAMDNTFKNITPSPGDADSTIKTKREALIDYLKSKASAPTAKGFGIDLDKFQTTTTDRPDIKTMGGIQYKKVPGGWAKI